jgi:hypothetical protein
VLTLKAAIIIATEILVIAKLGQSSSGEGVPREFIERLHGDLPSPWLRWRLIRKSAMSLETEEASESLPHGHGGTREYQGEH